MNAKYTHQAETLAQDAPARHVLLSLEFSKVEGACKHEHVGHVDQALQEWDGHLHRHPLRRLHHVQLTLRNIFIQLLILSRKEFGLKMLVQWF